MPEFRKIQPLQNLSVFWLPELRKRFHWHFTFKAEVDDDDDDDDITEPADDVAPEAVNGQIKQQVRVGKDG